MKKVIDKDLFKKEIENDLKSERKHIVGTVYSVPCHTCKHLDRITKPKGKKCLAFPDGIPEDILKGRRNHLNHIEGDRGYKYEPISEELDIRKDMPQT